MEKNKDPDEADAKALSPFIPKHFAKMASSLGGATSFATALAKIGILEDDNFDEENKAVVGGNSDDDGENHEGNKRGVHVQKERKVLQRYISKKEFDAFDVRSPIIGRILFNTSRLAFVGCFNFAQSPSNVCTLLHGGLCHVYVCQNYLLGVAIASS
jgi:hypothetical protein